VSSHTYRIGDKVAVSLDVDLDMYEAETGLKLYRDITGIVIKIESDEVNQDVITLKLDYPAWDTMPPDDERGLCWEAHFNPTDLEPLT
jgi:hypothetical protein